MGTILTERRYRVYGVICLWLCDNLHRRRTGEWHLLVRLATIGAHRIGGREQSEGTVIAGLAEVALRGGEGLANGETLELSGGIHG